MGIVENLEKIKKEIPKEVDIIAVSKTKPVYLISEAYKSGHKIFGENKVQEMLEKWEKLPKDIEWHLIGHLQTNKIKYIVPFVHLIHSVDSEKLLSEINKQAAKQNRTVKCLLQVYIAKEETKFGMDEQELENIINVNPEKKYPFIKICGLMGMASFTDNEQQIRNEFRLLKNLFKKTKVAFPKEYFNILSMGMSGDYKTAIEEGSNMIRVGSAIFGSR
jgi:PLP dependent protein